VAGVPVGALTLNAIGEEIAMQSIESAAQEIGELANEIQYCESEPEELEHIFELIIACASKALKHPQVKQ